ncbi:MAG: AraC family transcriptional regulator, partial [Bacteroidota bacterium]
YLIGALGWLGAWNTVWWTDKLTDAVWIGLATTVFFLGYVAIKQPEILRWAEVVPTEEEDQNIIPLHSRPEGINSAQKERLVELMEREKPYLNPRLTLSDLASLLNTNVHQLSRLINEGFAVNFYDFVNGYRVREFKRRVILPEYQSQTFLAIAFSVGFNSKTAFNRSFKKLTNSTPRQFLKKNQRADPSSKIWLNP